MSLNLEVPIGGGANPVNAALQYQDLLGWTYDPYIVVHNAYTNSVGQLNLMRIPLPAVTTITNVLCEVTALGLTLTHAYLGLYSSAGVVIGQTADQSTPWGATGATGVYTLPLIGGPYVCTPLAANDFLWAALYTGTFVTSPSFSAVVYSSTALMNAGCSLLRYRAAQRGIGNVAILPTVNPNGGLTQSNNPFWMAIS